MSFPAFADRRFQRRCFRFPGLYCVLAWSPGHDGQRCSLRNAARERRGPLPSIKAGALLDERRVLTELGHETLTEIFTVPDVSKRDSV